MKSQKPQTPMLQLRKASYTLRDYAEAFAKVGFGAEDLVKKYLDIYERVILEGRTRLRNTMRRDLEEWLLGGITRIKS